MARSRCPDAISPSRIVAAKSGVPMKTRSSGRVAIDPHEQELSGGQHAAALGLRELAQDHAALQRGDVIDEQNAVEMVDLVLQAGREQPPRLDLADFVLMVEIAQSDRGRALDIGIMLG